MSMEYATLNQIVQFGERDSLYVDVHVLPDGDTEKHFSWFADKENQELLALVYDAVLSEAAQLKLGSASSSSYLIKRSRNLRVLLKFRPSEHKQHLVIPEHHAMFSGLVPQAMFVSDEGRKVLPFLNQRTQSSGYKAFRISPNSMEVYVDCHPVTDSRGIFKVLGKLDPQHTLNTDLMSYFRSPSSMPTLDDVCTLSEIPVTLLKKKRAAKTRAVSKEREGNSKRNVGAVSKEREGNSKRNVGAVSKERGGNSKRNVGAVSKARDRGTTVIPAQGSIRDFIGRAADVGGYPPAGDPLECATNDEMSGGYVDLTEDAVEDFCHFGSQDYEDGNKTNPTSVQTPRSSPRTLDETPPLNQRKVKDVNETPPSSIAETPPSSPRDIDETPPLSPRHNDAPALGVDQKPKSPDFPSPSLKSDVGDGSSLLDVTGNSSMMLELTGLSAICTPEVSDGSDTNDSGQTSHTTEMPSLHYCSDSECSGDDSVDISRKKTTPLKCPDSKKQRLQVCAGDEPLLRPEASCSADIVDLTRTPLVSSNSSSSVNNSPQSNRTNAKKRKRLKSPLEGVECMADLTLLHLRRWMHFHKPLILDIFKRMVFSRRHEDYVSGNRKKREALKYSADTRMFTEGQAEEITKFLLAVFCGKHMKYFDYVMSVLLPECITRIVAQVHKITFIQAEEMVLNYEKPRSDTV